MKITIKIVLFASLLFCIVLTPEKAKAQLYNYYWAQSFNSVSSMLSGAVVAGDGGSSSIYYNPANISEIGDNSNLSISAVMFSWRYYKVNNGLGNGINLDHMAFSVQPRFITYVYNPPHSKLSIAGTVFTRIHERLELNYSSQQYVDVLKEYPGNEQYNAYFDYRNRFDDTWVGIATAYEVSKRFQVGVSAFVSSVSMQYLRDIENSAVSIIDTNIFSALYNSRILVNYTNYRMVFKIGITYKTEQWRFGLNISTPSINVLSFSKKLLHTQSQANISYEGKPLTDYSAFFSQEGDEVISNPRLPLSIAFGTVYIFPHSDNRVYFTLEHFFGIKPYLLMEAYPNPESGLEEFKHKWLSVASGSKSLTNAAIGFKWKQSDKLGLMMGFRTDFNYLNNFNYKNYSGYNTLTNSNMNIYHITGGAQFTVLKQKVIAGVELTYGNNEQQKQIANFSNPVEYNATDGIPLQGTIQNNAETTYFSINLYLSAVLNFGGNKKNNKTNK